MNCVASKHRGVSMGTTLTLTFLLLIIFLGTTAECQQLRTFSYPKRKGEVRSFDDVNPIWGPDSTLVFERIYKSGGGGQGLYWYEPFGENRSVVPLAVPEEDLGLDLELFSQSGFFASYFSWAVGEKSEELAEEMELSQIKRIYRFVYTQLPDIYSGEVTIPEIGLTTTTLRPYLRTSVFVSGTRGGSFENKYADYSPQSQFVAYVSGLTGQGDIYIKRLLKDNRIDENDPGLRVTDNNVLDLAPRWSPGGKHLAYASYNEKKGASQNMDIFLLWDVLTEGGSSLNPDRRTTVLTSSTLDEVAPTWSPDGRMLAFYSVKLESGTMHQGEYDDMKAENRSEKRICDLWVVGVDGTSEPVRVARDVRRQHRRGPVWLPPLKVLDGQYLIYTSGSYDRIYVLNADEAVMSPEETRSLPIEGLAGYRYKHVTDLDCTQFRNSSMFLAYSALDSQGQKRIYVERVQYIKPTTLPFSISSEFESDLDNGEITKELQREFENRGISLSRNTDVEKRDDEWVLVDGVNGQTHFVRKVAGKLKFFQNPWRVRQSIPPE